jgi:hypothetical protein
MTKQEFYDLNAIAAKDGTFPSIEGGTCNYRATYTATCKRKCPVGLLIPDDLYANDMEGMAVGRLVARRAIIVPEGMDISDLLKIQAIHDHEAQNEPWSSEDYMTCINALDCFYDAERR